jgi:hypothetical protein
MIFTCSFAPSLLSKLFKHMFETVLFLSLHRGNIFIPQLNGDMTKSVDFVDLWHGASCWISNLNGNFEQSLQRLQGLLHQHASLRLVVLRITGAIGALYRSIPIIDILSVRGP